MGILLNPSLMRSQMSQLGHENKHIWLHPRGHRSCPSTWKPSWGLWLEPKANSSLLMTWCGQCQGEKGEIRNPNWSQLSHLSWRNTPKTSPTGEAHCFNVTSFLSARQGITAATSVLQLEGRGGDETHGEDRGSGGYSENRSRVCCFQVVSQIMAQRFLKENVDWNVLFL